MTRVVNVETPVVTPVVSGFLPCVLERVRRPEIGLAVWHRIARRNLRISAYAMLSRPPFAAITTGIPDLAARGLCHELTLFHWPLYADLRRLAHRLARLAGSPQVRMRFAHVTDDSCRKFHIDAVGLRLLCTYAGAATEWIDARGRVQRLATMEVAVFKGSAYPGGGPCVLHRSPPLSTGHLAGQSRLVLCIDTMGSRPTPRRAVLHDIG